MQGKKNENRFPLASHVSFLCSCAGLESREVNRFPLPSITATAAAAVTEEKAELSLQEGTPLIQQIVYSLSEGCERD